MHISSITMTALVTQKSNVIIMADDIGCYGGEVKTPNLDTLVHSGLRYWQIYKYPQSFIKGKTSKADSRRQLFTDLSRKITSETFHSHRP